MNTIESSPNDEVTWSLCPFDNLDIATLYAALALRSQVFVVEQNCVYPDIDGLDCRPGNRHLIGRCDESICAYARSLAPTPGEKNARIGRVVVHPAWRRRGLGKTMIKLLLEDLQVRFHDTGINLDAQLDAEAMYAQAGFVRVSDVFLEDGIEHVRMHLEPLSLPDYQE